MVHKASGAGFGALLDRLIEERKLSNRELAKLAKLAPDTVRVQRLEAECRFRTLTAERVLRELSAIKPLSNADRALYVKLAGLPTTEAEPSRSKLARLAGSNSGADAEELFGKLVDEFGPARVADALRSIASVMRGTPGNR